MSTIIVILIFVVWVNYRWRRRRDNVTHYRIVTKRR
jgi:hypothetical protein